jgi:hypothetical protein
VTVFKKATDALNLVTPFFEPTRCQRPDRIFISQTGYLSDQFLSANYLSGIWGDIYQPNMYYSAKYLLFSQMGIIQSNIIQPNEILFSQVGILFSQTAGWLASEGRCELAKSLHSEICRQARYYYIMYVYRTNPRNLQARGVF